MTIFKTERLALVEFKKTHAAFLYDLVNDPVWIEFIGDKNVHSLKDAEDYIENRLRKSYENHGFGFYVVKIKETDQPVGMCGLVDRPGLDDIDIGFAFLKEHRKRGYGFESSEGMLRYANKELGIDKVVAITHPDNVASGKLLEKLGLTFDRLIQLPEDKKDWCKLYVQNGRSNL